MSTISAALQLPANAASPEVASAPGTAPGITNGVTNGASAELAGDDFVLALTRALSAAAPAEAGVAPLVSAIVPGITPAEPDEDEGDADELAASLAAMLSLPLTPPSSTPVPSAQTDALELLGVSTTARPIVASQLTAQLMLDGESGAATTNPTLNELSREALAAPPDGALPVAPAVDKPSQVATLQEATTTSRTLQSNVGTPAWSEELGTRVTIMAERGQHSASLRLSPEHLGPLEVRIAIRDDQASVWFGAAHADTRAAIEHALPRLREMFAAQGMSLTDAGVSREPPREPPTPARVPTAFAETANETQVTITTLHRTGLIDAYA